MATINVTKELISKLNYINTEGLRIGQYNFPDFLVIGPQRTGTTWLHRNLILHPSIFLPDIKELYFFNYLKIKNTEGKNYNSDRLEWYSSQFSLSLVKYFKKNLTLFKSYKSYKYLDYNIKQFFSPMISGEATASYAAMEEELINEIFVLNPSIKVIMMIRNPVDRAWSHAKLQLSRTFCKASGEIDFKDFEEFFINDYMMRCGKYTTIIQNWEKYTKPDNIFIGIFDDISKDPQRLLTSIFEFLNLPPGNNMLQHGAFKKKINPTASLKVPERQKAFLQELFKDEIQELNRKFNLQW